MATKVFAKNIKLSILDIKQMIHEQVADSLWETIFFENVDIVSETEVADFTVTISFVSNHDSFYFDCNGEVTLEVSDEEEPSEEVMI